MTNDTSEVKSKRPRWLYAALIASLALNLLVIGGIAGARFYHRHEHGLMGFVKRLPAERRAPIGEALRSEREKLQPLREAARASWTETNALLVEEPFDKEKLKAALARMNDAESKVRSAISEALAETAGKLDPAERRLLKEWRERKGPGGRWRRWHHDEGGKDE